MVAIKGHFDGKVFVPDEPVDLPPDQAVIMHIEIPADPVPAAKPDDFWHFLQKHAGSVRGPRDWSVEHDHYIHGTPKINKDGDQ